MIPLVARLLGWGGVIPFAFFAAAVVAGLDTPGIDPERALISYAAIILSFMGAVHWGIAIALPPEQASRRDRLMAISVLPALVGWAALLMPFVVGGVVLALTFAVLLAFDISVVRGGLAPQWYRSLRWQLTLAVLVCLLGAAAAAVPG